MSFLLMHKRMYDGLFLSQRTLFVAVCFNNPLAWPCFRNGSMQQRMLRQNKREMKAAEIPRDTSGFVNARG